MNEMSPFETVVVIGFGAFAVVLLVATFVEWRQRVKFRRAEEAKHRDEQQRHRDNKARVRAELNWLRQRNRQQRGA